ncbi:hypothetical protein ACRFBT_26540 [Pseudomonas aeruginosa]|uniref:hypothetical protein n=1 Tax=Pseudomonas aeruginosa TaxID=287 RepID=UPI003D7007F8
MQRRLCDILEARTAKFSGAQARPDHRRPGALYDPNVNDKDTLKAGKLRITYDEAPPCRCSVI